MKRKKIDLKKRIFKKIEFRHNQLNFIGQENKISVEKNKMDELDRMRIYGDGKKPIDVNLLTSFEKKVGIQKINIEIPPYSRKDLVDYDIVICIPSYNRYDKIIRLLTQFYTQSTEYTFKIILLNDGSTENDYDNIIIMFPDIIYIKNEKPNGKILHWYCYNQMWEFLKDIRCHAILQMDDDFILSDNFLNNIIDLFFLKKAEDSKIMAISPHLWSFKKEIDFENWWNRNDFVDGIALIDDVVIKRMEFKMKPVDINEVSKPGTPVRAWPQISDAIKNMGGIIYRTENSLVYHDGNNDSKLHGDVRNSNKGGVYTQKYIGNL